MSEDKVNYLQQTISCSCPNCNHNEFKLQPIDWYDGLKGFNVQTTYKECTNCGFREKYFETTYIVGQKLYHIK